MGFSTKPSYTHAHQHTTKRIEWTEVLSTWLEHALEHSNTAVIYSSTSNHEQGYAIYKWNSAQQQIYKH